MGDSDFKVHNGREIIVEADSDFAIREEGLCPFAEFFRESFVPKDRDHPVVVDMIEKAFDVDGEKGRYQALSFGFEDVMCE